MIAAKHLKIKYPYDDTVRDQDPIVFGAVVQSNWSDKLFMIYHTGGYKENQRWYMQGYPLVDGVPYKRACGWLNDLGSRRGDVIECFHQNTDDEVRVLWEPGDKAGDKQMELNLEP